MKLRRGKPVAIQQLNRDHRMKRFFLLLGCISAAALIACSVESSLPNATGKGSIRAINAIKNSPSIAFLIEEQQLSAVAYKNSTTAERYDDLEYRFNVEVQFAGESTPRRVASQLLDVVADKDYIFLISGSLANPTMTLWEGDQRNWDDGATVFETRFAHTAKSLGDIDVYFAASGVAPVLGEERGTLSFGQIIPAAEFPAGDYVLIMTASGDPSTIYFSSDTIPITAQSTLLFTVFDADANDTGPLSVRVYTDSGATSPISDPDYPPTLRFIHASMALATADVYNEETLTTPILTSHAFGGISADIPVAAGNNSLTYTAAGNSGAILFENTVNAFGGTHSAVVIIGADVDSLGAVTFVPNRSPVDTFITFSFMNAAANHPSVDVYIVAADADITDQLPLLPSNFFGNAPTLAGLNAGSYDLYLTDSAEQTVLAGPVRIDAALGDVINIIALDTVDPATAQINFIPAP